jgi:hypothetical protein
MTRPASFFVHIVAMTFSIVALAPLGAGAQDASAPLSLASAKVTIAGTSNIHDFTASTTDVRVTRLSLANGVGGPGLLAAVLNPGAVESFDIAVKAATLSSPKEGLDKNMHKALKATEFPDIVFRLVRIDGNKAFGLLKIAGVEKNVTFDIKTAATPTTLTVSGEVPLLMTDYGITPPKALMGMLKTDPKITVKFETVLAVPTTF